MNRVVGPAFYQKKVFFLILVPSWAHAGRCSVTTDGKSSIDALKAALVFNIAFFAMIFAEIIRCQTDVNCDLNKNSMALKSPMTRLTFLGRP